MNTQRVAKAHLFECAKSGALVLRTHNGAAPENRIMHVAIFRRDIEIAADNNIAKNLLRVGDAIPKLNKPSQLVLESRGTDGLPIRGVNAENANISNRGSDDPGLRIFAGGAQRCFAVLQMLSGQNRHAIIRFLPVENAAVSRGREYQFRKLIIAAFRFLQADDIRLFPCQPFEQPFLTFAQRIDIPGGDFNASRHPERQSRDPVAKA